jgi:hypothetical protein
MWTQKRSSTLDARSPTERVEPVGAEPAMRLALSRRTASTAVLIVKP